MDFTFLEQYDGKKVGVWHGTPVYAVSSSWLKSNPDTKMAYVVYDDSNKFIYKGKVVGTVSNRGTSGVPISMVVSGLTFTSVFGWLGVLK